MPKTKKNTGLLPQFENVLATPNGDYHGPGDSKEAQIDFFAIRKSVQRLYDQSPAIPRVQFVRELSDLLKSALNVEFLWIARFDFANEQLEILAGCSKRRSGMMLPMSLFADSPFWQVIQGNRYICPRNALMPYANNPYMIKFNIESVIAQPLLLNEKYVGFLSVMNTTPIEYSDEVAQLFESITPELTHILFSADQIK